MWSRRCINNVRKRRRLVGIWCSYEVVVDLSPLLFVSLINHICTSNITTATSVPWQKIHHFIYKTFYLNYIFNYYILKFVWIKLSIASTAGHHNLPSWWVSDYLSLSQVSSHHLLRSWTSYYHNWSLIINKW